MMRILKDVARVAAWWVAVASAQSDGAPPRARSGYEYVNPLIGTTNGGQDRCLPRV